MNDKTNSGSAQPLSPKEVHKLLGQHRQLRDQSCFQSAPEMWLKLYKVIGWNDYPEQSLPQNDLKGYEPYPDDGIKTYNGSPVHFRKETFHAPYTALFERLSAELAHGRFVVVSLRPPSGDRWHGYLVTHKVGDDFVVFTKPGVSANGTEQDRLKNRLSTNEKVDCLLMRIAKEA